MRFFVNHNTDPTFNLALEELLCSRYPEPLVMLWRNRPSVIVGRNQNTLAEINPEVAESCAIPVVRRMTGGGAVYHDLGNVNYSFVIHERRPGPESFALFAEPVVACLRKMGVPAVFSGRNDILAEGRKVSGSAQCCMNGRTLFHGTLLFDSDMEMLGRVLTPGKLKILGKGIKSVRSRVANLKEFLPEMDVTRFMEELTENLSAAGAPAEEVPEEWRLKAEELADARYRTWEWNFGSRFDFDWSNSGRFTAGTVELEVRIAGSRVERIRITGDFFGDASEIETRLLHTRFRRSEIAEALKDLVMEEHIHGLSKAEFLSLIND